MKKSKIIAFCLFLMLILTSCHGRAGLEEFVIPDEFDENTQYELTFWAKNDTNITQAQIYEQAIEGFMELYPNIKINLRLYTDYNRIYNDVITNIATNTTPNICITYPDHIATYMTGMNTVVPLDELTSDPEYGLGGSAVKFDSPTVEEIVPKFLEEGKIGGSQYALPFMRSTEACYVNKTYVEALGYTLPEKLTWDFIWEVSDKAAEKDENGVYYVNSQKVMIPFIYKSTDNMMIQYLTQAGGGYSTPDGEALIFNDTTKAFLTQIRDHTAKGAFSTFKISSYPANFLNAGQCIFAIDSTAGATWMGCDAPLSDISEENIVEFETVVMEIPQIDPENPRMISQGPSICIFNKEDSGEVMASWLFMQYLLTNDVQIAYSQTEGYAPVTLKAQESEEYATYLANEGIDGELHYEIKLQATKLLLDNIENTFTTPVYNGSASLRNAAGQLIENVTKSVRRKEEVDEEYFTSLKEDITSLYHLDERSINSGEKEELGPLPKTSAILLLALGVTWLGIIAYLISDKIKNHKKSQNY